MAQLYARDTFFNWIRYMAPYSALDHDMIKYATYMCTEFMRYQVKTNYDELNSQEQALGVSLPKYHENNGMGYLAFHLPYIPTDNDIHYVISKRNPRDPEKYIKLKPVYRKYVNKLGSMVMYNFRDDYRRALKMGRWS